MRGSLFSYPELSEILTLEFFDSIMISTKFAAVFFDL